VLILSINFEEILSCAHGNFEKHSKVLESSISTINYCIIITNTYYIINEWYNYYISNKGLLEECDK
jgi:hypothetical protein